MSLTVIEKPKVNIDQSILDKLQTNVEEIGQVVMHFLYTAGFAEGQKIRIWPTTYLYDNGSEHRSELVHFEQISLAPIWTDVQPGTLNFFTLIFSGLPKSCTTFDFKEHCDGGYGAFFAKQIRRNNSDVYFMRIQ